MMRKKISIAVSILFIIILFGCTAMTPIHPTKSKSEYNTDKEDCLKTAREYSMGGRDDDFSVIDEISLSQKCMREKGWSYKSK